MSKSILTFVIGAGLGATAAWFVAKTKYEKIAQEEIESVKEVYRTKHDAMRVIDQNSAELSDEEVKYNEEIVKEHNKMDEYVDKANEYGGDTHESTAIVPYIIAMSEFGEDEEYDTETLYYYTDGVLADANDEIIESIINTVGIEAIEHINNGEDMVYVRNERLEMEYEVVRELRTYEEAATIIHPQRED